MDSLDSEYQAEVDAVDVDALLASIAETGSAPEQSAAQAPQHQETVAEQQAREFAFSRHGQEIKVREDDPRFNQWLSQGYDYAENTARVKAEADAIAAQKAQLEQEYEPYRQINDFAKQNSDWWQHVQNSYQQRDQPQIPDELRSYLDPVMKDYGIMKEFMNKWTADQLQQQAAKADAELDQKWRSIAAKHGDLDFSAKGSDGLSLEQRVLNYAQQTGIEDVEVAFKAVTFEDQIKRAEERGRVAYQKEVEQRKRVGLLDGRPPASSSPPINFQEPRARGWGDPRLSSASILAELGI